MNVWNTPDWQPKLPHIDNAWKSTGGRDDYDVWPPVALKPRRMTASELIEHDVKHAQKRLARALSDHVALEMGGLFKWWYPSGVIVNQRGPRSVELLFRVPADCTHHVGQVVGLERFFIGGAWDVMDRRPMNVANGLRVEYVRVDA